MKWILPVVLLAIGLCLISAQEQKPEEGAKEGAAGGHYYSGGGGYEHHHHHRHLPPLIDDYVCDVDASILIVTAAKQYKERRQQHHYGGQGYGHHQQGYGGHGGNGYGHEQRGGYDKPAGYGQHNYRSKRQTFPPTWNPQGPPPPQGGAPWNGPSPPPPPPQGGAGWNQPPPSSPNGPWNPQGPPPPPAGWSPQAPVPVQQWGPEQPAAGGYQQEGYNKPEYKEEVHTEPTADRLRCSGIASTSNRDCHICCKLAARRDQSVSNHDVFGFLIDFNQLDFEGHEQFPTTTSASIPNEYSAPPPEARCICCAPKRKVYVRHGGHHHGGY